MLDFICKNSENLDYSWGSVLSLENKEVVITDYLMLHELAKEIKDREIYLLIITHSNVETFFFTSFSRSNTAFISIPEGVNVKNFFFESTKKNFKNTSLNNYSLGNLDPQLKLISRTPVVFSYTGSYLFQYIVRLTLSNELDNIARNTI